MNHVRCYVFGDCTRNEFSGHYTVQQAKHYCCYGFLWNSKSVTYNLLFLTWTFRKKKFDLSCVRTMTGNKGKARSLYFGPKSVNRMLLSTEKKRLLETGKTSPPSFKELLQILGRFVQFGQFYPISDPSVRFCAHPSDFGHFRSILNVFVPFRILLSDFRWLSSDFGYLLPFSDILIRFQTLLDRCCEIIRSHASVQLRTNLSDDFWLICWSL